jgi:hypothetical protein
VLHEDAGLAGRAPTAGAMLADACEAPSHEARCHALQRLGDVSLFFAGFFSGSFARKLVDIDYHIAMGGRAYGTLAGAQSAAGRGACSARCSASSPRSSSRWSMR